MKQLFDIIMKEIMLIPLRTKTGYSFLKSGLTVSKYVSTIIKHQCDGGAICDEGVLFGAPEFFHLMENKNKKPLLGMEVITDGVHLCLYVLNEEGYRHLLYLTSLTSNQDGQISFDILSSHYEGLCAVLVTNDEQITSLLNQPNELAVCLNRYAKLFNCFYLGVEIDSKKTLENAKQIREFALHHDYQCVALPHILYEKEKDDIVLKIMSAIANNETLNEKQSNGNQCLKDETFYERYYTKQEIEATNQILHSSSFQFVQKRGTMLQYQNGDSNRLLIKLANQGLTDRGLSNQEAYIKRLDYEIEIITSMDYSNYFLLVADYVGFAKKAGIVVGPGRGSAAGSLVSYALGITEVDPLKYDLSFERFLNPSRQSMPDIDIDFMDYRRDEVVDYLRNKYGRDRVANIITFQVIHAKQSLRDIGRVYSYNDQYINMLCKTLGESDSLRDAYKHNKPFKDLVDSDPLFLEIVSFASKIEFLPRQKGQHAAGIILNDEKMENCLPIIKDEQGNYTSQFEMNYLQEEGFIKMDLLGLKNLSIISQIVDLINSTSEEKIDVFNIPFDHPKTYQLIASGMTMGVFQLESQGMKKAIATIKPSSFDDVVALLALFRPGPMDSIPLYAKRKQGLASTTYLSEEMKEILAPTYGIIVYQEQISQIAQKVAGFSAQDADNFRRAISKKDETIISQLKDSFISGAVKKGMNEQTAKDIFAHIEKFANYGFNKAHSVAYAIIACEMAYLKAMYPMEFYACLLDASDSKFFAYMSELKKRGIGVVPPNVNLSTSHFVIKDNHLIFPLSAIKRIDLSVVKAIIKERENGEFSDYYSFVSRLYPYGMSEAQAYKLIDSGALDVLYPSRETLRKETRSAFLLAKTRRKDDGQVILDLDEQMFGHHKMNEQKDDPIVNLEKEYEALGMMLSSHPLEHQKERLSKIGVTPIIEANKVNSYYTIAGLVRDKHIIKSKSGGNMAFVTIFDQTGEAEVIVFPKLFETNSQVIIQANKNTLLLFRAKKEYRNDKYSFLAESIETLEVSTDG